ncbi:MAG: hypothetical protein ABEJ75_03090 [Candidatus Nanohaloarchaea archaeon]
MITFEHTVLLALLPVAIPGLYIALKRDERYKKVLGASRSLLLVLVVLAAAGPQVTVSEQRMDQPQLVVLKDSSLSASLMKYSGLRLEEVEVKKKTIASGNSSDLRNGILRNLKPDQSYLLVSDGRSETSLEGLAEKFEKANSTLNVLKPPMEREASATIEGPGTTVPGAENSYTVRTYSTGNFTPHVTVYLDSEKIFEGRVKRKVFRRSFSTEGVHRFRAVLSSDDGFSQNNAYYRTVRVIEKPEVLVVGKKEGLTEYKKFFDLIYRNSLPEDLSRYYAAVLKKSVPSRNIEPYVSRGNGVVYTGEYSGSMNVLPLKPSSDVNEPKNTRVILAIDVSKSTEEDIKRAKEIAYALVDSLPANAKVGAVAYARKAYLVSQPRVLAYNRERLKNKIARLGTGVVSFHDRGLKGAKQLSEGKGNIILMTDGHFTTFLTDTERARAKKEVKSAALEVASSLDARLFVVGVGKNPNTDFLMDLAERGGGFYRSAEYANTISFVFKSGGGGGAISTLVNADPTHFITGKQRLSGQVTLFDRVSLREGANLVVASSSGNPVLATWRYGLGRVAAFSADTRDLRAIRREEPSLAVRSLSWAVGDPKRKEDEWAEVESARRGESPVVRASYPVQGLKKQGERLYTKTLDPERLGFHSYQGLPYAYNYRPELEEIGYSDRLSSLAAETGGEVYRLSETGEIKDDLKEFGSKKVSVKRSASPYLLAAALLVFISEIGYRKLNGRK